MDRTIRMIVATVLATFAFETTVVANRGSVKPSKAIVARPSPAKPAKVPTVKTTTVKTTTAKSVKPVKSVKLAAPIPTAKPTKPAAKADAKLAKSTAKADGKLAKSTAKADRKSAKSSSSTTTSTTSPDGTTTETPPPAPSTVVVSNPIADKISRNPKLEAKIAARLPAGMTLAQASTGFKNQGQFMAAVNVSRNLGIDFVKLQTAMTGQTVKVDSTTHAITTTPTGVAPLSLGQSIQKLKPGVDADAAVVTAQAQTSAMVTTTTTTSTTSTTTTTRTTTPTTSTTPTTGTTTPATTTTSATTPTTTTVKARKGKKTHGN